MAVADGALKEQALRGAGFNDAEITQWRAETTQQLQGAGFGPTEVDQYFGAPSGTPTDVKPGVHANLKAHLDERTPEGEGGGQPKPTTFEEAFMAALGAEAKKLPARMLGGPIGELLVPSGTPDTPAQPSAESATSWGQAFMAGLQGSSAGLMARKALPDRSVAPDAGMGLKIMQASGQLVGDVPAMVAGGFLGGVAGTEAPIVGNVAGASAGAFALPAMLRRAYIDDLQKGAIQDFSDVFVRVAGVAYDGIKGGITGLVTHGVAGPVGKMAEGLGSTGQALAEKSAELATMTTVGKALEGQAPKPEDFLIGAATLVGFHGALHIAGEIPSVAKDVQTRLQNIYAETGVKPQELIEASNVDPVLKQELLAKGTDVPPSMKPAQSNPEFGKGNPELTEPHPTLNDPEFGSDHSPTIPQLKEPEPPAPPKSPGEGEPPLSDRDAILSRIGEQGEAPQPKWDGWYTKVVDRLNPVYQWVKAVAGGEKLPATQDPYAVLSTALSRGFARADEAVSGDGHTDFETGKSLGTPSLKDILEPFKKDMQGFKAYLIARHSLNLEERGIETGVPKDASQRYVDENSPKYESAMKELVQFQNQGLDYLTASGYLTKDQASQIKSENPYYIPMRRVLDEGPSGGPGGSNPIKAIHGSKREIIDPIESIIKNQFAYYKLAEQNRGKQSVVYLARQYDAPEELLSKVPGVSKPVTATEEEVGKWMEKNGIDGITPGDFTLWRPMALPVAENEFAVMRNGAREIYSVDPSLAKALSATEHQDPNLLMTAANVVAKVQRVAVTDNPFFLLIHGIRDQFSATIQSQNGYRFAWDGLRGALHLMMGSEKADEFLRNGGGMATMADFDKTYVQSDVWGLSKETGLLDKTWNVVKTPFELQHALAQLVFTAPKMGEFLRATEAGKDSATAAYEARRVTSDVQQQGSSSFVRGWSAATPFFSMRIRGMDRMVESFKTDPIGTSTRMTLAITLPSILNWMMFHDDDRYKNAPNWEKDLYWVIPAGDTTLRIPKPFEPGLLFGSLVERTLNEAYDKDPGSFKAMDPNFFRALVGGAVPNVIPPIIAPALEQFANRSWLTGGQLVPHSLEGVSPAYQYNNYTTETAKALGKMIRYVPGASSLGHGNVTIDSPMVVENYVRAWGGNVGMYALQLADKALEKAGINPTKVAPKSDNWAKNLADIPFVKSFFIRYPSGAAQPLQDFYDNFEKAQTRANTLSHLRNSGSLPELRSFTESDAFTEHVARMTQVQQALSAQGQMIQKIYAMPGVPADAKRQQIDGLYSMMINAARLANENMRAVDEAVRRTKK